MKLFPFIAGAILTIVLWLLIRLLLWSLHRQWWDIRSVRRVLWYAPFAGIGFVALWTLGSWLDFGPLRDPGVMLAAAFIVLSVALLISLPFSGIILMLERLVKWTFGWMRKPAAETPPPAEPVVSPSRRSFVTHAAAAAPVVAITGGTAGLIGAHAAVRLPEIPLLFEKLSPALIGLRILQISDMHLNAYTHLDDLERLLINAEALHPDLVLVTGDIADDVPKLPDALRLLAQLKPRHGTYATLGNHEYYFDFPQVLRSFERGPIPLLRGTGISIAIGDATLYLAGADDPVTMKFDDELTRRLVKTIDESMRDAPSLAFKLLMSHRPEGFDVARQRGIELTLSGHTHGRQLGFNGRSIFESLTPERYLWGHYQKEGAQLYTTAGVGHWFPFRLGCPPEAPLFILGER